MNTPCVDWVAQLDSAGSSRARHVPDDVVDQGLSRPLADKSRHRPPELMQVIARAVSAFQAGHEGSIPFARSNRVSAAQRRTQRFRST
jgi:hypothetical protein